MHADDTIYTRVRNGVVVVSGTGPAIRIDSGRLVIRDGPQETPPLRLTRAEARRQLRHVIVCGDFGGYISFDALRWLRDTGVAFSQLDWNGTVIAASPTVPDQPALRRAQALVSSGAVPGTVAAITRQILSVKLAGQARVARLLDASTERRLAKTEQERRTRAIARLAATVARETDVARMLVAEAQGAALYWTLWNDLPVRFARQNPDRLGPDGRWQPGRRDPWHTFGPRASLLTGQPYRATTPGNAVLNWLYAVCQIELTIALLTVGVDPGVGLFHVDMVNRPSLTLDAIEALRPYVDHWLASYLAGTVFANRDFTELRDGEVRLTHPLNAHLAHTAALWRKLAEPVAVWLRNAFLRAVYARVVQSAGKRTRPAGRMAPLGAGAVPRLKPLAPLLPLLTRSLTMSLDGTESGWQTSAPLGAARAGENLVASACRECGRALPTAGRRRAFCSLSCAATNRAARPLRTLKLSPDQARLRAAIVDHGLTLTDVANACGVTRGAVGQWFINGPNERPIPERHMATIRRLLTEPNATTRRFK
jgi:CRISPR-associated endonuclease Cas1